jgi:hypothetical protein
MWVKLDDDPDSVTFIVQIKRVEGKDDFGYTVYSVQPWKEGPPVKLPITVVDRSSITFQTNTRLKEWEELTPEERAAYEEFKTRWPRGKPGRSGSREYAPWPQERVKNDSVDPEFLELVRTSK